MPIRLHPDDSQWHFLRATVVLGMLMMGLSGCKRTPETTQVSERPQSIDQSSMAVTQPRPSRFGLRARVAYADIEAIAASELPDSYTMVDSRRLCKRVIGIKACGTANWDLTVTRRGTPQISGNNQLVSISTPLAFDGVVGMDGKVAKALGLAVLEVQGSVVTHVTLGLTLQDNWCPTLKAIINYDWIEKPTVMWRNTMDFNLENIVNDALDKQLATLEPRLNRAIDCEEFRSQLAKYWRSYTFALDIPAADDAENAQQVHLNIVPKEFAFSGIRTESNKLGVSFTLDATTVVASAPLLEEAIPLPALKKVGFQDSKTLFDILLRADYTQLQAAIQPRVTGRSFSSDSPAGHVTVTLTSIDFSGNPDGITVALGFTAKLPTNRRDTSGIVYLNATPVVDTELEQLSLSNVRLSKVLDSTLWNLISLVFEGQIISAIERNAVFDLADRTRQLEQRLIEQLHDPARTGGINVEVQNLNIKLLDIIPEYKALAARARVSAELDLDIPLTVIQKPLQ